MNLRQLSIFCAVCEEMSFTRAAKRLYMTQPAVSHVIAGLERETGCVLFDRISRGIHLTGAGRAFYEKAARIVELMGDLERSPGTLDFASPLRIGSSITIANVFLPDILHTFSASFTAPVSVSVDTARHNTEKLLANEIDAALIEGAVTDSRLVAQPFSSFSIAAVCAPTYPIPRSVSPVMLARETLLLREKGSSVRELFDSAMMLHGLVVKPAWTSVDSQALVAAAGSSLGVSILPEVLIERELAAGELERVHIRGMQLKNTNYTVYHKDKYLSPPLAGFLEIAGRAKGGSHR
ncbi:LysR family transcriptional regulator [Christensenella tenuis]|jgi:DNA-binding transcriptional LysR family regulator|uniref:LysR family transcriptional regulator n=1 Tax=Christensenella tenuis TaxID=2763033 RepID=A0ABR7EGN1_9FIRM|nr:LysR family transcriptional regulator [Christensenella tenuis]MBC5648328.1 LysR family transcriptional regulator [Christensenella tenuis]